MKLAAITLALVTLSPLASARGDSTAIDLRLGEPPVMTPTNLWMRQREAPRPARPAPDPEQPTEQQAEQVADDDSQRPSLVRQAIRADVKPPTRLEDKIIFRFNLGFGMDGGQPSGETPLVGGQLDRREDYAALRPYGFGDFAAGSRGLLMPSLSSYFSAEFRIDQQLPQATGAVPSVYYFDNDHAKLLIRHGYAQADGFFDNRYLEPVYLRAGRQFKYGVAVAHFDGATVGYDTRPLSVAIWGGSRVSLYGFDDSLDQSAPPIAGTSARLDLFELRKIPLVFTADTLDYESIDHREYGVAFRWSPDVLIRGSFRRLDGEFARQSLSVWRRVSKVTTFNLDIDNRTDSDWMYDLMALRRVDDRGDPRSYLDLGPPLGRMQFNARAGTVILSNLDLLLRSAAAVEHESEADSPWSPSYFEGGVALEIRLRRNVRLGSSFTGRRYRQAEGEQVPQADGFPDDLPTLDRRFHERSFFEGGVGIDYSAGARRFNASGEFYGRAYRRDDPYSDQPERDFDTYSGGRFRVEGWAASRLRILAEYDVSLGALPLTRELRGVKMLRVLTEGTF